jgi:hypothetical protein
MNAIILAALNDSGLDFVADSVFESYIAEPFSASYFSAEDEQRAAYIAEHGCCVAWDHCTCSDCTERREIDYTEEPCPFCYYSMEGHHCDICCYRVS